MKFAATTGDLYTYPCWNAPCISCVVAIMLSGGRLLAYFIMIS
jgi:hypothetical protein